jgi:phage gp45-like
MSLGGALRGLIVRAIARITRDSTGLQQAELAAHDGQARADVEVLWPYGLTAHPHPGGITLLLHVGGDQSDPVALPPAGRNHRRVDLTAGQVSLYDSKGTEVHLCDDDTLVIRAALKVRIETPRLEVTGEIIDRADSGGSMMSAMRAVYDGHTHPEPDGGTGSPNQNMGGHG